jgi:hypothetical protein
MVVSQGEIGGYMGLGYYSKCTGALIMGCVGSAGEEMGSEARKWVCP